MRIIVGEDAIFYCRGEFIRPYKIISLVTRLATYNALSFSSSYILAFYPPVFH